jgi:hypothetical protein
MSRLDLGSLIVGILVIGFTFNPQVLYCLSRLYRIVRSILRPSGARCELLLWRDFNPGKLHCHSGSLGAHHCTHCTTAASHEKSTSCWTSTLALAFNNAWNSPTRKRWAPKPEVLPVEEDFVRTEAKVILAYFLVTARVNFFAEEMLGSRMEYVELMETEKIVLAHLGKAQRVLDLTKTEVENILDGWPPFYRESFTTVEGHVLNSPIATFDHVRRPAWIVAIGLGRVQPTDVYVDRSEMKDKALFHYALHRLCKVIKDVFSQEWPGNSTVTKLISELDRMTSHGPSAEAVYDWKTDDQNTVAYPMPESMKPLTAEQCRSLLRVFGDMSMTPPDKSVINEALGACLERVKIGAWIANKYVTGVDRRLKIPASLQGDRTIYVQSCSTSAL